MQLQKKDTNMPSTGYLASFGGYDRRAVIQEGAWSDMRNMSPRRYPAICTRPQRRSVTTRDGVTLGEVVAMCDLDGLVWIDSSGALHTDGQALTLPVLTAADLQRPQQLIPFGSYVVIWPARKWVNVQYFRAITGTQLVPDCYGSMDASWDQTDSDTVRLVPCQRDGSYWKYIPSTALESSHGRTLKPGASGGRVETSGFPYIYKEKAGDAGTDYYGYVLQESRPEKPEDGMLWMNPGVTPPVLQRWNEATGMWAVQELYLRLEHSGGFAGLQEGDAVTVTLPEVLFCTKAEALQQKAATIYYKEIKTERQTLENAVITASGDGWICIKAALAQPATVATKHRQLVQCAMFAQANIAAPEEAGTTSEAEFAAMTDAALEAYCTASANNSGGYGHPARVSKITLARTAPEMDFVIECGNRLWGCRYSTEERGKLYNEIYASKLGDFKNWNCFAGLSTDSYAASRGAPGAWTGAVAFGNYPLFFKRDCLERVYISSSGAHQIVTTRLPGVQPGSDKSLQAIDGVLFYLSDRGVMAYDGSMPESVSAALGAEAYTGGVAGSDGQFYYLAAKCGGAPVLLTLDTETGLWHRQDETAAKQIVQCGTALYLRGAGAGLVSLAADDARDGGSREDDFAWRLESGLLGIDGPGRTYLLRITIRAKLEAGASATVSVQHNEDGRWKQRARLEGNGVHSVSFSVGARRCDTYRLRLDGVGQTTIYSIAKTTEAGSELE